MKRISNTVLLFLVLLATLACLYAITDSENPPATFQESDLVGTWQASYGVNDGIDTLILRPDGTFMQTYESRSEDYIYETPWNEWWMERFPDGRVRVHLEGARYYYEGIEIAEWDGIEPTVPPGTLEPWISEDEARPFLFYDPFASYTDDWTIYFVEMVEKLVLNVRLLPSGELVLAHMWDSSSVGFGSSQVFHRIETSSPVQTPAP